MLQTDAVSIDPNDPEAASADLVNGEAASTAAAADGALPTDEKPPAGRGWSRRGRRAVTGLAVVAVLLIVASVSLAVVVKRHSDDVAAADEARVQAVVSARQSILNLDSLSASTIDRDLARVTDGATGTFKAEFAKAAPDLKKLVVERKTVSSGEIRSAGIVRSDNDTATVLVAVDRTIKDSTNATGVVARDRWRVDLEVHGGRWLVSDLQPVS